MRVLTVTLMLLLIGLAGCAGDDQTNEPADQPAEANDADDGNTTVDPTPTPTPTTTPTNGTTNETVENLVPVVNFTADAVNGTSPLLVNFTISVEDDSENLTWTFFVGENETLSGSQFPAMFNHTFAEGVWNVSVTVDDGAHVVEQSAQILVSMAVAGEVQTIEGSYLAGLHGCINNAYPNAASGTTFFLGKPAAHTYGKPFEAVFEATGPVNDYTVYFWSGGSPAGKITVTTATVTGIVPNGVTDVFLNTCGGADVSVTYRAGDI